MGAVILAACLLLLVSTCRADRSLGPPDGAAPLNIARWIAERHVPLGDDDSRGETEWWRILTEDPPLRVGCGYVALVGKKLFEERGFPARLIAMVTTDPWDGLTDGHTALEIWVGKWILVDLYWDTVFQNAAGQLLSLWEVSEAVLRGDVLTLQRIDSTPDTSEEQVRREYARRAHVPLIYEPPPWYYPRPEYVELLSTYPIYNGWSYMPLDEWLARFYRNPS